MGRERDGWLDVGPRPPSRGRRWRPAWYAVLLGLAVVGAALEESRQRVKDAVKLRERADDRALATWAALKCGSR